MFSLPNPKKTITIDFSVEQVMSAIPKIHIASNTKYKVTEINPVFNQVTLEAMEFLSLGVYIDFNLVKKSDTSTEITIEIRRKFGTFDTEAEVTRANDHFKDLVNHLSAIIVLSPADFDKKYVKTIEGNSSKPWYTGKNVATMYIIFGIVTLPIYIGFLILPLGLYARKKNKEYLSLNS